MTKLRIVEFILVGLFILFLIFNPFTVNATWVERTNSGQRNWQQVVISSDATKIAAVVYGGYIYTSNDSGATWTERTNAGTGLWTSVASSSDGVKLAATVTTGGVYTSNDSGATWTERTNAGTGLWTSVASSSDGVKLAIVNSGSTILVSNDSGDTWTSHSYPGTSVTMTPDGSKLVVTNFGSYSGNFHISLNGGDTWTTKNQVSYCALWEKGMYTPDGSTLFLAGDDGDGGACFVKSTNDGTNFTYLHTSDYVQSYFDMEISSDGMKIAVAGNTSINGGVSFSAESRVGQSLAMTPDGNTIVTAVYGGYIYTKTIDVLAPSVSLVASTPSDTSADISWTTDESSSSIVDYGLTNAYGTSTSEADTSPRVTSHSVNLPNLLACTTYNYRVKSKDTELNLATGSNNTFTTTGCTGSATVLEETQESIPTLTGGTKSLLSSGKGISLDIPAGSTSTDAIFQIKSLDPTEVFLVSGTPNGVIQAGNYAFDLKALTGVGTSVTSFLEPIELTFTYDDADVTTLDESSLVIYRWDGATWNALTDCLVDATLNTITCTTTNFSVFSIFGTPPAVVVATVVAPANGVVSATFLQQVSDNARIQNIQTETQAIASPVNTDTNEKKVKFTKNLKLGTIDDEVRLLQKYLNNNGYTLALSGPGSIGNETNVFGMRTYKALIKFQKEKGIVPSVGYFGAKTINIISK